MALLHLQPRTVPLIEVWVENETMVEILPPEYPREYLAFARPDKVTAAMAAAPGAAARQRQQA